MNLYQIEVEVQDGAHIYTVREFVVAQDECAAKRHARLVAARLYPHAQHDGEADVWSDADGREWCVARVSWLSELLVPVAGGRRNVRMALVPLDSALPGSPLVLSPPVEFVRAYN